ncbi:ribosomal protein L21-like protein, partial [Hyaloraphidium curvatum]
MDERLDRQIPDILTRSNYDFLRQPTMAASRGSCGFLGTDALGRLGVTDASCRAAASRLPQPAAPFLAACGARGLSRRPWNGRPKAGGPVPEFTTQEEELQKSKLAYHQRLTPQAAATLQPDYVASDKTAESLALLRQSSTPLYAIVEMKGRPYFVTAGDIMVSEHMKEVQLGDVLRFDRIREVGNKDYAVRGAPLVSPRFCNIRAVCIEHTWSSPTVIQKRRRKGMRPVVVHRDRVTMLRVAELSISDV